MNFSKMNSTANNNLASADHFTIFLIPLFFAVELLMSLSGIMLNMALIYAIVVNKSVYENFNKIQREQAIKKGKTE